MTNASGIMREIWHVTGGVTATSSSSDPLFMGSLSGVGLAFECASNSVGSSTPFACGDPFLGWSASTPIDTTVTIDVPFRFGVQFDYSIGITISANTGFPAIARSGLVFEGAAAGDLAHTGRLVDVMVLDSLGHVVSAPIQSDSGFDYAGVPEPGTRLLGCATALALGVQRARSRTTSTTASGSVSL